LALNRYQRFNGAAAEQRLAAEDGEALHQLDATWEQGQPPRRDNCGAKNGKMFPALRL
jgi:hypothetical protein